MFDGSCCPRCVFGINSLFPGPPSAATAENYDVRAGPRGLPWRARAATCPSWDAKQVPEAAKLGGKHDVLQEVAARVRCGRFPRQPN